MKKLYILPVLFGMLFCSCDDYLNVGSETELTQEQIYSTDEGFHKALTGIYVGMGTSSLYGAQLTWKGLDILAHHYENISANDYTYFHNHDYGKLSTKSFINGAWNGLYNLIYRCNDILENLEDRKDEVHPLNYEMIRGEALALRAFFHFDLLRLFGHGNYANRSAELSNIYTIPYVTRTGKETTPQATYAEVFKYLKTDLNEAAKLLWGENGENCNITYATKENAEEALKEHFSVAEGSSEGFWTVSNYAYKPRINYYGVKAILSRVHMWEGTEEGYDEVLHFIEKEWIPAGEDDFYDAWDPVTRLSGTYHNRIFRNENIWHLWITGLNDIIGNAFEYSNNNLYNSLRLKGTMFQEIFEYNTGSNVGLGDFLANNLYVKGSGTFYQILKLDQYEGTNDFIIQGSYGNRIPLISTAEFYYYAAEIYAKRGDYVNALTYLNTIRKVRGITANVMDTDPVVIKEEILKEWRKEYIALGHLFFLYKRWGLEDVFGITMGDAQYVLPFPEEEIITGNREQYITEEE